MGLAAQTFPFYDNGGGVDLKSSPTKVPEANASLLLNTDYSTDGAFYTRNGSTIVTKVASIPTPMAGNPKTLLMHDLRKADGNAYQVVAAGTTLKLGLVTPVNEITGLNGALPYPDMEQMTCADDDYLIWGNGVDTNLKFNGSTWTNLSFTAPVAPVPIDNGVGVLVAGTYDYYVAAGRLVGGILVQEGPLSPVGSVTIAINRQIRVGIPVITETVLPGVSQQANARVIYRASPTSAGVATRLTIVTNNVSTFYDDNNPIDGSIEPNFFQIEVPKTSVFEEYERRLFLVDSVNKTDVYYTDPDKPWSLDEENFYPFDGPVRCIRRSYGALFLGTDRSLWIWAGDPETNDPRRISSTIGVLNNRCAVGETFLYIIATNKKFYPIKITDFSQTEIRTDDKICINIQPLLNQISGSSDENVCMEYENGPDASKVLISCPIGSNTNNHLIVYNETQYLVRKDPCWQYWDNINASALRQMTINGVISVYSGDYNGFIWKIDDPSMNGDGAEENGTATSSGATTLVDTTKIWTPNIYRGVRVRIISGTGINQVRTISSNTIDTLTVDSAWATNPDNTSEYTIGGYDVYHYSNWKKVLKTYDFLKQLWFIWVNANASGDYEIEIILQIDFDQTETNQISIFLSLAAANTIWGQFIWGQAIWGAFSVFQDRIRQFARFRAIRIGFRHRKAGQPFQINGFSLSCQDKGLLFKSG